MWAAERGWPERTAEWWGELGEDEVLSGGGGYGRCWKDGFSKAQKAGVDRMSQSVASEDSGIEDGLCNHSRLPTAETERWADVAKGLDLGSKKTVGIQTGSQILARALHFGYHLDVRTGRRDECRPGREEFLVSR